MLIIMIWTGRFSRAMVLMNVVTTMGEHEVGAYLALQLFEIVFHLSGHVREIALAKAANSDIGFRGSAQDIGRARTSFPFSIWVRGQHYPRHRAAGALFEQSENGCTATNLDIVGVRAQTQQTQR